MKHATLHLPPKGSVLALLKLAKRAIESGDKSWLIATEHHRTAAKHYRTAAEHLAKAQHKGASQRLIAKSIGKSAAWVNRLLSWRNAGFRDETPFAAESKAKRQRARVQEAERAKKTKDEPAVIASHAEAAKSEVATTRGKAEISTRAPVNAVDVDNNPKSDATATQADIINFSIVRRAFLVERLELLATERPRLRAALASQIEQRRAEIGLTWDQLLIPAADPVS